MPTYIRIGKKGETNLCGDQAVPAIGSALTAQQGANVCILAVGTIAQEAVTAGEILRQQGLGAEVVLFHTVKPTPIDLFNDLLNRFSCFITVEEHSRIGGFGEAFLSYVASKGLQKKITSLGAHDTFMPVVGSQHYARSHFGIDAASIVRAAEALVR
jgi:transketolase